MVSEVELIEVQGLFFSYICNFMFFNSIVSKYSLKIWGATVAHKGKVPKNKEVNLFFFFFLVDFFS